MDAYTGLTKENLQEWKATLKKEMFEQFGVEDYDLTYNDEDWLNDYIGFSPQDAIDGEVECWEE